MIARSQRNPSSRALVERLEDRIAPATLIGLNTNDQLLVFESTGTATPLPISVTGLQPSEHLLGIDFRPATGELFALGDSRRLYTINLENGAATAVNSTPFDLPLEGEEQKRSTFNVQRPRPTPRRCGWSRVERWKLNVEC